MRRPPGLWILLSAGVVWLSLQDVYGIRATSLIFGKSTTTTTTTTAAPEQADASEEETVTTELGNDANATKPTLTGVPQVDYIWDPNLPKELNGYNLSDYPFYERVPEDIDFKCDGLHDGFYASVPHKCQVYHHCLFGTRYDFLCANYTAFDQKTFICHFASEVDCANSKKFWHRNDALYKSATTTTIKPFVIYTPPPKPSPVTVPPQSLPPAPVNPSGLGLRRPAGGRRRPFRRRRPQSDYYEDDYYEDYYEERPRSNRGRKRPRPRPRPLYDDEYDEEYEDRYERKGGGRRDEKRRPYDRRPNGKRRNNDRGKDGYDDDETDGRFEDEEFKANGRRKPNERKPFADDERYPENRKRRPTNDRNVEDEPKSRKSQRRPPSDDYEEIDDKRPRRNQRRPANDDYEDTFQTDDSRSYDRPRKNEERRTRPKGESKTIIKPVSGTIYDRPRVAPRIKLPVPKNEANKYAYKSIASTQNTPIADEEYYDDYEEEPLPKRKENIRADSRNTRPKLKEDTRPKRPDDIYETYGRSRSKERDRPKSEEYYDDYEEYDDEEESVERRPANNSEKREKPISTTSTTTTTTTEEPIEKVKQPIVRLVKRPFLPSRGGNPYAARGLQPVGSKALEKTQNAEVLSETEDTLGKDDKELQTAEDEELKPIFKPSPVMIEVPLRAKLMPVNSDTFRSQSYSEETADVRTTPKPRLPDRNPLEDIAEEEYDVTLNDALNPTLPNLPIRGSPAGFSPSNDYVALGNFQRSRYVLEPVLSQTGSEYVYQTKPQSRDRLASSDGDYKGQYSTIRESYRPRRVQQRTEAFFARY